MRLVRPIAAALLSVGLLLSAASAALAQDGDPVVILDEPLPTDAAAGSSVAIAWSVEVTRDDGTTLPVNAEGVFLRLTPASGEPIDVAAGQDRPGHYRATVTVPEGGLGAVAFGLRGSACYADGHCERSDSLFKVVDRPVAVVVPPTAAPTVVVTPAAPTTTPATSFDLAWVPLAALVALTLFVVVLAFRERRGGASV